MVKGQCDACGKMPRILEVLGDGRSVCRRCIKELGVVTVAQLQQYRETGYVIQDDVTKQELEELGAISGAMYYYTLDLWEEERGVRIIHDELGVERQQVSELSCKMVSTGDIDLFRRLANVQWARDEKAEKLFQKAKRKGRTDREYASAFRPSLVKDKDYRALVAILGQEYPGFSKRPRTKKRRPRNDYEDGASSPTDSDAASDDEISGCAVIMMLLTGAVGLGALWLTWKVIQFFQ